MNTKYSFQVLALIVWGCGLLFCPAIQANPSSSNPISLFEARSEETSQEYWKRADEAFRIVYEIGVPIEQAYQSGDVSSVKPGDVGDAYALNEEIRHCSERLYDLGEPVAQPLGKIHLYYKTLLDNVITEYRKLPGVAQSIQQSLSKKSSKAAKAIIKESRKLKKIQGLAKKQEWAELDEAVHEVHVEVIRYTCWLSERNRTHPKLAAIFAVRKQFREQITDYYQEEADLVLSDLRDQNIPDLNGLVAQLRKAVESVGRSGNVSSGDETLSGPEWLMNFSDDWEKTLVKINRVRGIEASHTRSNQQSELALKALDSNTTKFVEEVYQGIADLITAEASQTAPEDVPAKYDAYLRAVNQFLTYQGEEQLQESIDTALVYFAQTSSEFGEDVNNYKIVTNEVLKWRKRQVDSQLSQISAEFTPVLKAMQGITGIGREIRHGKDDEDVEEMRTIIDLVKKVGGNMMDKQVTVDGCLVTQSQTELYTSVDNEVGAVIPFRSPNSALFASLGHDLLINESRSLYPLSLEASLAMYRAQRGDCVQVGGTIKDFEVQSRVTQLSECTQKELARETVDTFKTTGRIDAHKLIRQQPVMYHIDPAFVRYDYFLVVY